jgi:hypothetical protein
MTRQTSDKQGVRAGAQKQTAARHSVGPMPATQPVPGAFGKQRQRVPRAAVPLCRGSSGPTRSERTRRANRQHQPGDR